MRNDHVILKYHQITQRIRSDEFSEYTWYKDSISSGTCSVKTTNM